MTEHLWYIRRCGLFQKLSDRQLALLETQCRAKQFARGTSIYLPNELADGVLLLASGRAKICSLNEDGKQVILTFIEPGELFGELALFGQAQRDEHAEAVEKSTVVLIPREVMQRLVEEDAHVSCGVTKLIGLRRRRIESRLKYLLFRSNRERLVSLLLELAEQYGQPADEGLELRIRLSHQDLSSIIGSTRETVTVLLGDLQAEGLLRLGRRRIVIRDLDRLAAAGRPPTPAGGT